MQHYNSSLSRMNAPQMTRPVFAAASAFGVCNLLDEQGREIQITEAMILNACAALRRRCRLPKKI